MSLERRNVEVELDADYREIGIRSFGRGIFHKEIVSGADLGTKRVFWIEPNDLVISNVFAWEGAIAVASSAELGMIGSHRFMTFVPIDGRIDTSWAAWFFQSEPGLELIGRASPGSAGRNRTLSIERFAALEIPLPPVDQQRNVADWLDGARRRSSAIRRAQLDAGQLDKAVVDAGIWGILDSGIDSGWPVVSLGEIAEINPRRDRLQSDELVSFVPMAAVSERTGSIESPELREAAAVGSGFKQFKRDDVIFARITPCMQNGKTAIFDGGTDYGYGSTEFHVVRPGAEIRSRWVHMFLRTQQFRDSAAQYLTGTAGQQRLSPDFLRNARVPLPSVGEQDEALAIIDRLLDARDVLRTSRATASDLAAAIEPSMMNEAFVRLV